MVEPKNIRELEKWLHKQPRKVCVAIATRSLLRVFPLLQYDFYQSKLKSEVLSAEVVMPILRAAATTWCFSRYKFLGKKLHMAVSNSSNGARDSAAAAASFFKTQTSVFIAHSAQFAAEAVTEVNYASVTGHSRTASVTRAASRGSSAAVARSVARSITYAIDAANEKFVTSMSSDVANAIKFDIEFITRGGNALSLTDEALWPVETPKQIERLWSELNSKLDGLRENWECWIIWYDAVLKGVAVPGGEELDYFRALLNDEKDWMNEPFLINLLIKRKETQILGDPPLHPAQLDLVQYPASFVFDFVGGKLSAKAVIGGTETLPEADDMRLELIKKLRGAEKRLRKTQCPLRYLESLDRSAALLETSSAADLPAGKVLSAYRSVETDVSAICSVEGRNEYSADAISIVEDAFSSFEDFKAQLPNVIKLETNRLTLKLAIHDASEVNAEIEKLITAVTDSTIVSQSAIKALVEGQSEVAHYQQVIVQSSNQPEVAAAKEAQAATVSQRSMVVRNFVVRPLKFVGEHAATGIGAGIEKSAQAATIAGISALAGYVAGPLLGLSALIASFVPLAKRAEEVSKLIPLEDNTEA